MSLIGSIQYITGLSLAGIEKVGTVIFALSGATFALTLPVWLYLRHSVEKRRLAEENLVARARTLLRKVRGTGDFPWLALAMCSVSGFLLYRMLQERWESSGGTEEKSTVLQHQQGGDARRVPRPLLLGAEAATAATAAAAAAGPDCDSCAEAERAIRKEAAAEKGRRGRYTQSDCPKCQNLTKNRLERNESARERRRRGTVNMTVTPSPPSPPFSPPPPPPPPPRRKPVECSDDRFSRLSLLKQRRDALRSQLRTEARFYLFQKKMTDREKERSNWPLRQEQEQQQGEKDAASPGTIALRQSRVALENLERQMEAVDEELKRWQE